MTLPARLLSRAEIAYARTVFGDSLDYTVVRITVDSLWSWRSARTLGNTIHLWYSHFEDGDGTRELTRFAGLPTLIHELTHVWQFQKRGYWYLFSSLWGQVRHMRDRARAYDWQGALEVGKPWGRWTAEQQAQAVQDSLGVLPGSPRSLSLYRILHEAFRGRMG